MDALDLVSPRSCGPASRSRLGRPRIHHGYSTDLGNCRQAGNTKKPVKVQFRCPNYLHYVNGRLVWFFLRKECESRLTNQSSRNSWYGSPSIDYCHPPTWCAIWAGSQYWLSQTQALRTKDTNATKSVLDDPQTMAKTRGLDSVCNLTEVWVIKYPHHSKVIRRQTFGLPTSTINVLGSQQ